MKVCSPAAFGLAAAIAVVALTLSPTPAAAACAAPPGAGGLQAAIAAAPLVFVGAVTSTSSNDRVAVVRVESIWKGPRIPETVVVSGTPEPGAAATSVDRTYSRGQRYLFFPYTSASPFQDSSCSATRPYTSDLDQLRPAGAVAPHPGTSSPDASSPAAWPWLVAIGVALMMVAAGVVLFVRRRGRND